MVLVNNHGQLTAKFGLPGTDRQPMTGLVVASDFKNPHHFGHALVALHPIFQIKFLPSYYEAEVGSHLYLYVAMLARLPDGWLP